MPFMKCDNSPVEGMNCEAYPGISCVVDRDRIILARIDVFLITDPNYGEAHLQNLRDLVIIKHHELIAELQAYYDKHNL